MLVLSRRVEEAIVIGDNITVRVLGIDRNGVVRLGVDAPRSVRIVRSELVQEVQEVNRKALAAAGSAAMLEGLEDLLPEPNDSKQQGGANL